MGFCKGCFYQVIKLKFFKFLIPISLNAGFVLGNLKNCAEIIILQEKEELIEDWQPEPLVPDVDENHPVLQTMSKRLVEGYALFVVHFVFLVALAYIEFCYFENILAASKSVICMRKL